MSSETSGGVNFIVGDEDGVDQAPAELVNGDLTRALEEEKHENTDSFPLNKETRMGVTSNSSSYNNMFGLTERRKRLRYVFYLCTIYSTLVSLVSKLVLQIYLFVIIIMFTCV